MKSVKFVIFGTPKPHQRPRFGRHGHVYTPPDQVIFQRHVAMVAKKAAIEAGGIFFDNPVKVSCKFRSKHYAKDRNKSEVWGGKGDLDNFLKNILDSLNGIVYKDDKIVCAIECDKKFTQGEEHSLIEIEELEE